MSSAKERILEAASELFSQKGYAAVSVREIAKRANCSHTSIYVYFQDKRGLLEALALPPIQDLNKALTRINQEPGLSNVERLVRMSEEYVSFGFKYLRLYETFMTVEATKVDAEANTALNQQRLEIFHVFQNVVEEITDDPALDFNRILFYLLHGTVMTYIHTDEPIENVAERVLPLVRTSVNLLVKGGQYDEN